MLHMVAVCPAAYEFHEFKLFQARDANGPEIPYDPKAGPFESGNGVIKAPQGSGLGITIDPDYVRTHEPFEA